MKKGVLQMMQLNLKRNNAQGLRNEMNDDQQGQDQEEDIEQENGQQQQEKNTLAMSFTIPEIAVEGQCQTQYTINTANPSQRCTPDDQTPCSFNVTKSINFKQCSKIADVAFSNQIQEQQPHCTQCQQQFQEQMPQECARGNCFYNAADQSESNATFHFILNCEHRPNMCHLKQSNMIQSYTDGNFSHIIVGNLKLQNVWQQNVNQFNGFDATDETSTSLGYDYDNSVKMPFPMFGNMHNPRTLDEDNCDNCEKKRVQLAKIFDSAIDILQESLDLLCEIDNNTSAMCKDTSQQIINSFRFTRIVLSKNFLCVIISGACRTSSPTACDTCEFLLSTVSDILETIDEPLKKALGFLLTKEPLRQNALASYNVGMVAARATFSKLMIPFHCTTQWGCNK